MSTTLTNGRVTPAMPPSLILFFHYRSLMESGSMDHINFEGWKEVLDAFGYEKLTLERCVSDLALKSPHEVMTSLCPFTTKAEWAPLLNKRDVRLEKDVSELCYTEVLPLQGFKDFIIDCARQAQTTVVMLSPFREVLSRQLLEKAELSSFVDVVVSYTEREFGILEALERLNIRPPKIPKTLNHKWEVDDDDEEEESEEKADNDDDEETKEEVSEGPSPGQPHANSLTDEVPAVSFFSFETDVQGVKFAHMYGVKAVGVSFNLIGAGDDSAGQEIDDDGSARSVHNEAVLLQTGAALVVKDFVTLKYEYLHHIR